MENSKQRNEQGDGLENTGAHHHISQNADTSQKTLSADISEDNIYSVQWRRKRVDKIANAVAQILYSGSQGMLLVKGETGSGKSTLLPLALMKILPKISTKPFYICIPTRSAAILLKDRVRRLAIEDKMDASTVGHAIGGNVSKKGARIVYVTAGWMRTKLEHDPKFIFTMSCIVIDECHQESDDVEMTIGQIHALESLLRKPFNSKSFPFIIMMSATFNENEVFQHFRPQSFWDKGFVKKTISQISYKVEVPDNAKFTREEYFLDDLKAINIDAELTMHPFTKTKGTIVPTLDKNAISTFFEILDYCSHLAEWSLGNFMAFLPGINEIGKVIEKYDKEFYGRKQYYFFPVHSKMDSIERKEFERFQEGEVKSPMRKVMLCTNMAESSMTINNISVVVDFALEKLVGYNEDLRCETLTTDWTGGRSIIQRKGRCGRTCNSVYFNLTTRKFNEMRMRYKPLAEIQRKSLHTVILRLMEMQKRDLYMNIPEFTRVFLLKHLLHKITETNLSSYVNGLLSSGNAVLSQEYSGKINLDNVILTYTGKLANKFPVTEEFSRMILWAGGLGMVAQSGIFLAAAISCLKKGLLQKEDKRLSVWMMLKFFSNNIPSDPLAVANIFRGWLAMEDKKRVDEKPKKSKSVNITLSRLYVNGKRSPSWTIDPMNQAVLTSIDDITAEIYKIIEDNRIQKASSVQYRNAATYVEFKDQLNQGLTDAQKERMNMERMNDTLLSQLMIVACSPLNLWFTSYPPTGEKSFNPETDGQFATSQMLIIKPCLPIDCDITKYAPLIQMRYGQPLGIYPALHNDPENNRIVLIYPGFIKQPLLHNLHLGPISYIHRHNFFKDDEKEGYWDLRYKPTKEEEGVKCSVKNDEILFDTLRVKFHIATFYTPQNFSVRPNIRSNIDNFLDLKTDLDTIGSTQDLLVPLRLEQVQIGKKVIGNIYENRSGNYYHRWARGIILNDAGSEDVNIPIEQRSNYSVAVDLIDSGETVWTELEKLFDYEEETQNYGYPDIFSRCSRLTYKCVFSNLKPVPWTGFAWPTYHVSTMTQMLKGKPFVNLFNANVLLDVVSSSESQHLIVVRDMKSVEGRSFVNECVIRKLAVEDDSILHADTQNRKSSNNYVSAPTEQPELPPIIEDAKPGEIENFRTVSFYDCYSPLEVQWSSLCTEMKKYPTKIAKTSFNSNFLDEKIGAWKSKEAYDPLLMIASATHLKQYNKLSLDSTTILPPINGIVGLCALVFLPVVEILRDKATHNFFAIRVLSKKQNGKPDEICYIELTVEIDEEDEMLIEEIRIANNKYFMEGDIGLNKQYRKSLLAFFQKERQRLNFPNGYSILKSESNNEIIHDHNKLFMVPKPIITTVEIV